MDATIIAGAAGSLLSLVFSYFPGLNTWYAAQTDATKKLVMLGLLVAVAAIALGLACANLLTDLFGITVTCDRAGIIGLLQALGTAIVMNQGTYLITPQTEAVKETKAQAARYEV